MILPNGKLVNFVGAHTELCPTFPEQNPDKKFKSGDLVALPAVPFGHKE